MDCIFCKIINNEVEIDKLYEDDNVIAMLDIKPASKKGGHCLVIPKKHYELITDIEDDILFDLIKVVKKLAKALLKFGDGLNILQNNKRVSGQAINHAHFHLIPRFKDDSIRLHKWESYEYKNGEMKVVFNKIKNLLKENS